MPLPPGYEILQPPPRDRRAAVEALLRSSDPGHADRFLAYAASTGLDLDRLLCVAAGGAIRLSLLGAVSPGRTATLFVSPPRDGLEVELVAALVEAAAERADAWGVTLFQALVSPEATGELAALERGGLARLATLRAHERPLPRPGEIAVPATPDDLAIEPWREGLDDELVTCLGRTYEGTLDCPGLTGLRRGEDILAGHRATGRFEPRLWHLLRIRRGPDAGSLAGACLMNAQPGASAIDLVYLGLAPAWRGRGAATLLLAHALAALARRRERRVTLAVDTRNAPAEALYRRFGFRPGIARIALIRPTVRAASR